MADPVYPQYSITIRFEQDGEQNPGWKNGESLPEGRIWNSVHLDRMYREDRDVNELLAEFRDEWWPKYVEEKELAEKRPGPPMITVRCTGRESWVLEWFQHKTFDVGQSDEEALASFERFVRRYEHMQEVHPGHIPHGYRCLMGAEDRWRWSGGPGPDDRTAPPCRCEHCKEQGVLRIGH